MNKSSNVKDKVTGTTYFFLSNISCSKLLSVSSLRFPVVDSPPVEKILSTGAAEAGVMKRSRLIQTKIIKMTSLKIFLVLVLVHAGKNNYSLVLVLVKVECYILV